jgi:D-alanyl-D-alanine carboxypeptidase
MAPVSRQAFSALHGELGIPADYGLEPALAIYPESVDLVDAGLNIVGRMQSLTPATATAWLTMQSAARETGIELLMVSGFRSIEYQASLIRKKLEAGQLIEDILKVNVAPGFSQHHTGNAVDIATPGSKPLLEEFESSAAFAWLLEHAGDFGFRMSYPRNNPEEISYEPWHWYRSDS